MSPFESGVPELSSFNLEHADSFGFVGVERMSVITAQILIGESHPNHGGIYPTHVLYLSEQGEPSWILTEHRVLVADPGKPKPVIWIPTMENMLEDALLMISHHVLKKPEIAEAFDKYRSIWDKPCIWLPREVEREHLARLHAINQGLEMHCKLMINLFVGSSVRRHLPVLEKYGMELEVTAPIYSRVHARNRKEMVVNGSLHTAFNHML